LANLLVIDSIGVSWGRLLQHMAAKLLNLGQAAPMFGPVNFSFVLIGIVFNLMFYLLTGLFDELLSVYEVLLDSLLCLVFRLHVLVDMSIIEVFPSA